MTVIERMARAIDPGAFMPMSVHLSVRSREDAIRLAMDEAKAALSILLEEMPEETNRAGGKVVPNYHDDWSNAEEVAGKTFHAMIKALIEEAE